MNKVKCNSCGNEYDPIYIETNQASECSSEVDFELNEIVSCYGSKHDFHSFEFINGEIPDWVESGTICDLCIDSLLDEQYIKIKRSDIW